MSSLPWTYVALCMVTLMIPATTARADVVLDWNAHAARAIVTVGGQVPPRALIRLAMVHLAIYDAVDAIEGTPFESYASVPDVARPASAEAAAATAAHHMLVSLFPAQMADLDAKYAASLAALPDDIAIVNGIAVGQQAASAILNVRVQDGRDATVIYVPGSGPGVWVPTPPAFLAAQAPETQLVQPFVLNSASQFRPEAPFHLTGEDWARDFNEVKALGSAVGSSRTPEQTDIARFWSDNPPLQWNRAWRALSVAKGLGLPDNARYFAMLTSASADALIACWDAKYVYNFWRPVTAIGAGDSDGNPETAPDPAWIGIVVTPNHPEYPAAHGCFSGASTETLKYFFGTDKVAFWIESTVAGLVNPLRTYFRFSDALIEVLAARIYGGMHYRNSTRIGANMGRQVSRFTTTHFFRPAKHPSSASAARGGGLRGEPRRGGPVGGGGTGAGGTRGSPGAGAGRARPRAGAETRRCGSSPEMRSLASTGPGPCHARAEGFDLHAGVVVPGRDRARLERTLSLRATGARRAGPDPADPHRPGSPASAAPLGGWDDASPVRTCAAR